MNFITKSLLLTLYLGLFLFSQAISQELPINFTQTAPIIDGVEDAMWSGHQYQFIGKKNQGTVTSAYDLSGTYKMCWDDTNLYLLVLVDDDVVRSDNSGTISSDDGIEVYIDINNDKATTYGANDYQYTFRYNDATISETKHNSTANVAYVQTSTSTSVTYEIKLPWATLGAGVMENYIKLGLDIHLNDDDSGVRDGKLAWFGTNDLSYTNPSLLGTILLDGKNLLEKIESPVFSHQRGFYTNSFTLQLTSTVSGATIYYTLDGSDPRYSTSVLSGASPQNVTLDPASTTNRGGTTPVVVVRAISKKATYESSDLITHSYIFTPNVITQWSPYGNWPSSYSGGGGLYGAQNMDYKMDPDVCDNPAYSGSMEDALKSIPTISLVSDLKNIFDKDQGIYMNPIGQGINWERPVSVELINADGSEGFQIDAGLRIRGGYSRYPQNAKHSFRLFFRDEYGNSKLKFRLFEKEGTDEFTKVDLSTAQNYSWSKDGSDQNNFLKDLCFRDIQGKMGHYYSRSRYNHLYVNGMYWGLFLTQERPEADFADSYMGGSKDDYDVVKPERNLIDSEEDLKVMATDGTMDSAQRLYDKVVNGAAASNQSYFEVQGMNPDGTRNLAYERLLDVDNLVDYLHIAYYGGSYDAPISGWAVDPTRPNNYFAIYNRNNPDGFKWFVHDFEHSMNNKEDMGIDGGLEEDWITTRTLANFNDNIEFFNPVKIHLELMANPEYKIKFADRVFRNFTKGGYLYPDSVLAVFANRKAQIDMAIIAESARWGDTKVTNPRTKADWLNIVNILEEDYIPFRTQVVVDQLKAGGMYPAINPPMFELAGVEPVGNTHPVAVGAVVKLQNSNGTTGSIYYTTDGNDPRAIGGAVNTTAINGADLANVTINVTTNLKTRVLSGTTWSALNEKLLMVETAATNLRVTEIHYNPLANASYAGNQLEFVELKNTGTQSISLTGLVFNLGIQYAFGAQTLEAGDFVVLASNMTAFNDQYGFMPDGQFTGNLNNAGEAVVLADALGTEVISVTYDSSDPWPLVANGLGNSLVPYIHNPQGDPSLSPYWKASSQIGGSPGEDDPDPLIAPIIINEVLSHSDYPYRDAIELYNPTNATVDISNWYLSDLITTPNKWKIPAGTTIPALGYKVIYQGHYVNEVLEYAADEFGSAFGLSENGESVFLVSADAAGNYTGYNTAVGFGAIETNYSFGRYQNSVGDVHFVAQNEITLGTANSKPRVGPLVIKQIMFNPDLLNYEYIEIKNITGNTVNLFSDQNPVNTWKVSGTGFVFPQNVSLESGESLYIIQSDITPEVFREGYGIDVNVQVFNMATKLSNSGESVSIQKAGDEYLLNGLPVVNYILIEEVLYGDASPWPNNPDGDGASLIRLIDSEYGNDPINWGENFVSTSIEESVSNNGTFLVYPNPSKGIFNVVIDNEIGPCIYKIVNTQGQVILENKTADSKFEIDLGGFSSGIYILVITHDNGTLSSRLIVN